MNLRPFQAWNLNIFNSWKINLYDQRRASSQLFEQKYEVHILAFQELKWSEFVKNDENESKMSFNVKII